VFAALIAALAVDPKFNVALGRADHGAKPGIMLLRDPCWGPNAPLAVLLFLLLVAPCRRFWR